MTPERLEKLVVDEHNNLCSQDNKRKIYVINSLEVKALINIIAPKLKDIRDINEMTKLGELK